MYDLVLELTVVVQVSLLVAGCDISVLRPPLSRLCRHLPSHADL